MFPSRLSTLSIDKIRLFRATLVLVDHIQYNLNQRVQITLITMHGANNVSLKSPDELTTKRKQILEPLFHMIHCSLIFLSVHKSKF